MRCYKIIISKVIWSNPNEHWTHTGLDKTNIYILPQLSSFPENMSNSVKELFYRLGPSSSVSPGSVAIVFVKTRAAVKLLSVVLATHPIIKDLLRIGTFVGIWNHNARTSNIGDLIKASD